MNRAGYCLSGFIEDGNTNFFEKGLVHTFGKLPASAFTEDAGKYVVEMRINTQIDTSTDSKQVSKSIVWYRLASKGIDVILYMLRLVLAKRPTCPAGRLSIS